MHNNSKHSLENNIKEKHNSYFVYVGLAIIVCAVVYFLFLSNLGTNVFSSKVANDTLSGGSVQKVVISMKNNNYFPNSITVKVNQPVEITLDSSVGGCYRTFVIPEFRLSQYSIDSNDKITFTPTEKGTFEFKCGMGMGRGTLVVE